MQQAWGSSKKVAARHPRRRTDTLEGVRKRCMILTRSGTAGASVSLSCAQVIGIPIQSPVKTGVGVLQEIVHLRVALTYLLD